MCFIVQQFIYNMYKDSFSLVWIQQIMLCYLLLAQIAAVV
jgi:hypothetical protein